MNREELAKRISDLALLRGEFTLRSGRKSNYYLDKYRFETQPDVLKALGKMLAERVTPDIADPARDAEPSRGRTLESRCVDLVSADIVLPDAACLDLVVGMCDDAIAAYKATRGAAIWKHRATGLGQIPGGLRYDTLKRAGFRCELCGVSADERALGVGVTGLIVVPEVLAGTKLLIQDLSIAECRDGVLLAQTSSETA